MPAASPLAQIARGLFACPELGPDAQHNSQKEQDMSSALAVEAEFETAFPWAASGAHVATVEEVATDVPEEESKGFFGWIKRSWNWVKDKVVRAWNWTGDHIERTWNWCRRKARDGWDWFIENRDTIWRWAKTTTRNSWNATKRFLHWMGEPVKVLILSLVPLGTSTPRVLALNALILLGILLAAMLSDEEKNGCEPNGNGAREKIAGGLQFTREVSGRALEIVEDLESGAIRRLEAAEADP